MTRIEKLLLYLTLTNTLVATVAVFHYAPKMASRLPATRRRVVDLHKRLSRSLGLDVPEHPQIDVLYNVALDVLEKIVDVEGSTSDNP